MKVVIMAGGKGTRIAEINSNVPKPMILIDGKPILQYQIETLSKAGYCDIILIVGYMGDIIKNYFENGKAFGVEIHYIVEESPLGTAGALYYLKDKIKEDFLLINGDIIFNVNIQRFVEYHQRQGTIATILTHPNSHPYDSGIIMVNKSGRVVKWLHKEDERKWYQNRVNAGLHLLSVKIFDFFPDLQKRDLDRDVLKPLIGDGELSAYDSPEYIKDMGTPDRYYSVIKDIKEGKVEARNLSKKQKAIFLDRDGTINRYVGFLKDIEEFELLDGVSEAIKLINNSNYLAIVVTNQPVIARGEVTLDQLKEIHNKMETLLGMQGAFVDDIFFCPHHPHKGFEGECTEYKIDCECRKPKPGLLLEAAKKYNIDLSHSWMIGDGENDVKAGLAAGCSVVRIGCGDNHPGFSNKKEFLKENVPGNEDVLYADDLLEAVKLILEFDSPKGGKGE